MDLQGAGSMLPYVVSRNRILYLGQTLLGVSLVAWSGFVVDRETNSLSVQLDIVGMGVTALTVVVNLFMELAKQRTLHARTLLMQDVAGCVTSLTLLLGVTLFGVLDSILRTRRPSEDLLKVEHLDTMVVYCLFVMLVTGCLLAFFVHFREQFLLPTGIRDGLNMLSCVVHMAVSFGNHFVVLAITLWLRYGALKDSTPMQLAAHKTNIDAIGGLLMFFTLALPIVFLGNEMQATMHDIDGLPATPPESDAESHERGALAGEGKTSFLDYGAATSLGMVPGACV